MLDDPTEITRRIKIKKINATDDAALRAQLRWTSEQLRAEFDVLGFMAPYVIVRRKVDGVEDTMAFKHDPRIYFGWEPNA